MSNPSPPRGSPAGTKLDASGRCPIIDELFNADPMGELTIRVPHSVLDPLATTLAVDIDPT
jgi:alpha-L-fucosidase